VIKRSGDVIEEGQQNPESDGTQSQTSNGERKPYTIKNQKFIAKKEIKKG